MAQQQFSGGNFTPMSGIPERVGLPIEDIRHTAEKLQASYDANKDAYFAQDAYLKNMPKIDKSVDDPLIASANQVISNNFKSVIENDDFSKAKDVVKSTAQYLTTDTKLKALSSNYAALQASNTEWDKRIEKAGTLRIGDNARMAEIKKRYREQGGSVDAAGNSQALNTDVFTSDLDIGKYKKEIYDKAHSMHAVHTANISEGKHNMGDLLSKLPPAEAAILRSSGKFTQTDTYAEVTKERIQDMAKLLVESDPMYQTTLREYSKVELFNATGKLEADLPIVSKLLANNTSLSRNLALNENPGFIIAKKELSAQLERDFSKAGSNEEKIKLNNAYKNRLTQLENNSAELGAANLTTRMSKDPSFVSSLYTDMATERLNQSVLHSGDSEAYKDHLSTSRTELKDDVLTNRLLKHLDEDTKGNLGTVTLGGSQVRSINVESLNGNSAENIKTERDIAALNLIINQSKDPAKVRDARNKLNAIDIENNTKRSSLMQAYLQANPQEQERILKNANMGRGSQAAYALYERKFSIPSMGGDVTIDKNNINSKLIPEIKRIEADEKNRSWVRNYANQSLGHSSDDLKVQMVMLQASRKEVMSSTPQQLINKYGKGLDFSKAKDLLTTKQKEYSYDLYKAIASSDVSKRVVSTVLLPGGISQTPAEQQLKMSVVQAVLGGNTIDGHTGEKISADDFKTTTEGGRSLFSDKDLKNLSISDLAEASVTVATNMEPTKGFYTYQVSYAQLDANGKNIGTTTRLVKVPTSGFTPHENVMRDRLIETGKTFKSDSQSKNQAYANVVQYMQDLGRDKQDVNGKFLIDIEKDIASIEVHPRTTATKTIEFGRTKGVASSYINVTKNSDGLVTAEIHTPGKEVFHVKPTSVENIHSIVAAFDTSLDETSRNVFLNNYKATK